MHRHFARTTVAALSVFALTAVGLSSAEAAVPTSKRFDLSASLVDPPLLKAKSLKHPTVLQSFAYDPTNKDIYAVQVKSGESAKGNLVVTRTTASGKEKGYMVLNGFGHGATIGVQRNSAKNNVYLWVESHAKNGFGTRVSRVKWSNKSRPTVKSGLVVDLTPTGAADKSPRPVIDQKNHLLVVRTSESGKYVFRAYNLSNVTSKKWAVVYKTTVPKRKGETSQGTTAYGSYIYTYWGNHSKNNTWIESYKIVHNGNATLAQRKKTEAYKSLDYREPEGISIAFARSSKPVLAFGFASGKAGARKATIAGKAVMR